MNNVIVVSILYDEDAPVKSYKGVRIRQAGSSSETVFFAGDPIKDFQSAMASIPLNSWTALSSSCDWFPIHYNRRARKRKLPLDLMETLPA